MIRRSRLEIALLAACAAGGLGCVHTRIGGASPGHVELWQPPSATAARGAGVAAPVSEPALVISSGALVGTGARRIDGVSRNEGGLGFELGLYWTGVTYEELALGRTAPDIRSEKSAFGLNLGWTPSPIRSGPSDHQPTTYLELQWRQLLYGVAAGLAFSPGESTNARTGVQLTPLLGPFYSRLQWLFDGSISFELGLAIKLPVLVSFGG